MVDIIYQAHWFYGKDFFIDAINVFVLLIISIFAMKYYRIHREKKTYLLFIFSFLILAISFFFRILTNAYIYHELSLAQVVGKTSVSHLALQESNIYFFTGLLTYRLGALLGLLLLYVMNSERRRGVTAIVVGYLLFVSTYFTKDAYYVFHLSALVILAAITYLSYTRSLALQQPRNLFLAIGFGILAVSQLTFVFVHIDIVFYIAAELIQLLGYLFILGTFILVILDGKNKG